MKTNYLKKLFTVALATTTFATMVGCASNQPSASTSTAETEKAKGDTTKPEINFVADSVTVETGAKYSATENIKSVTDDTDGTLTQVKQASKGAAYYLVDDSKVDTSKAGECSVTVTAVDKAGNTATKSFKVVVKDAEKKETAKTEAQTETKSDSKKAAAASKTESKSNTASTKKTNSNASSAQSSSSSGTAASNSNSSASSQTATKQEHVHSWTTVQHEATGHNEEKTIVDQDAYDEEIVDQAGYTVHVCNWCSQRFTDPYSLEDHYLDGCEGSNWHDEYVLPVTHKVHHDAVTHTESVWVQDSAAWTETVCSTCGAKK